MAKEWYIQVEGEKQGPFSIPELKIHPRITPDTLVWKEGFDKWHPIRYVPDLKDVFKDDSDLESQEIVPQESSSLLPSDQVLAARYEPPQFFIWLMILLFVILYVMYMLGWF